MNINTNNLEFNPSKGNHTKSNNIIQKHHTPISYNNIYNLTHQDPYSIPIHVTLPCTFSFNIFPRECFHAPLIPRAKLYNIVPNCRTYLEVRNMFREQQNIIQWQNAEIEAE